MSFQTGLDGKPRVFVVVVVVVARSVIIQEEWERLDYQYCAAAIVLADRTTPIKPNELSKLELHNFSESLPASCAILLSSSP